LLYVTRPGQILQNQGLYRVLSALVNIFRSIPFIIGAAPTVNGTIAACKPIDVPTMTRVNGIIQTSRIR
jgi:ABC-type methionine transport system permease subunit